MLSKFLNRKFVVLCILSFVFTVGMIAGGLFESGLSAQNHGQKSNAYTEIGPRAGVWKDGQAALWDLNVLDHFRLFGHKERVRGHAPEQPIKFSHVTHVQNRKIECQFCHWTVGKSPFAAIPEVETCMGCHKVVAGTEQWQKDEIAKVAKHFNEGTPIPWAKVHVMPDHVKFNHKRHVKAGVSCHSCHGQIPEMQTVERVSSMKMGWCIDCHRNQGTTIDCNSCHY
jgi:hypothetical protein